MLWSPGEACFCCSLDLQFLELNGVSLIATRHENGELTIAGRQLGGDSSPERDSFLEIPAVNWLLKQNKNRLA